MHLRAYDPADALATLAVFRRAVRVTAAEHYDAEQIAAWSSDDIDPAAWAVRRAGAGTVVAVDDAGSGILGFSDVDGRGYIDMLFVDPSAGRQGVATALLGAVTARARQAGASDLCTHASLSARPFFERHGFSVVEEGRPVVRGVVLRNFVMRRSLA
ncbi:GNAT family N-acetyltransferase [Frondihabitans cladoniiphilus]|uniref:GNAT family N-acetyltransferase n=1 Tax=Frondihabitans cladoniiphilus TaxID=715785 RepID=A0ABP8W5K9_9MICO